MIGFSIMTWFIAVIMIGLSISLLKGNYTFVHGNVFDRTKDKAGYAKKLGKPVLLLAVGIAISGVLAVASVCFTEWISIFVNPCWNKN